MYVALDPIGSSSKKKNNKNSQIIKTTQTTPQVDPLVAIEEEKRRKRVQENRMLMNDVKKASSEISESYDELTAIEKMLDKCITGEFAKGLKSIMQNAQGQMEKVVNDLNVIGTKAAQNVEKEGEVCTYDKQQLISKPSYNGNGKKTFSCNTDAVRKQILPRLQAGIKKLAKTTTTTSDIPRLEDCEDVTNVPNCIDGIAKLLKNSLTEIECMLERAEQAEAETEKIVEQAEAEIDAKTGAFIRLQENPNYDFAKVCKISMEKVIESIKSKFSRDITYDTTTITKEGNLYIRKCDVSVPSTMDTQNQPKDIIIFLNGYDKNGNPKKLLDIINGSELEKPYAIIIEPRNLSTSNSSIWTSKYAVKELQAILEEAYEDYGLLNEDGSLREDETYTIIRI